MELKFPENFLWGTATSAYQVEGGNKFSDWDKVYPAGIACDHYNRFEEDFDLVKNLNQNSHRFSIEWARIEPEEGKFNKKEIEHYRDVLIALKRRSIKSMVCLHHFTSPSWFTKKGGFAKRKNLFHFQRYASKVFDEYKSLVDFWIIFNEPQMYAGYAYIEKIWPPHKRNPILYLRVIKNLISVHRFIHRSFHQKDKSVLVGIAKDNIFYEPYSKKSPLDWFSTKIVAWWQNHYFLNKIKNQLDFIGLNYYFHNKLRFPFFIKNDNRVVSDLGWEIYPRGIYYLLKDLERYKLPIYVVENGLADKNDKLREDFIKDHLYCIWKTIQEGVNVKGYFYWSLMDNLELHRGFGPRFGLIEIDYKTLERRPRKSAYYYAEICKNNKLIINDR